MTKSYFKKGFISEENLNLDSNEKFGVLLNVYDGTTPYLFSFNSLKVELIDIAQQIKNSNKDISRVNKRLESIVFEMISKGVIDDLTFSIYLTNYIASLEITENAFVNFNNQSIGFILTFDLNVDDCLTVEITNYLEWELQFQKNIEHHNQIIISSIRD